MVSNVPKAVLHVLSVESGWRSCYAHCPQSVIALPESYRPLESHRARKAIAPQECYRAPKNIAPHESYRAPGKFSPHEVAFIAQPGNVIEFWNISNAMTRLVEPACRKGSNPNEHAQLIAL